MQLLTLCRSSTNEWSKWIWWLVILVYSSALQWCRSHPATQSPTGSSIHRLTCISRKSLTATWSDVTVEVWLVVIIHWLNGRKLKNPTRARLKRCKDTAMTLWWLDGELQSSAFSPHRISNAQWQAADLNRSHAVAVTQQHKTGFRWWTV